MMRLSFVGKKFGRLTVLSRDGVDKFRSIIYLCRCSCGSVVKVRSSSLKSGHTKSCGCLRSEESGIRNFIHGMSSKTELSAEYSAWNNMKNRCYRKSDKRYMDYGGRGISVCRSWVNSFSNFLKDVGPRPTGKHSLDRIDNNAGYSKSNCRWATKSEQSKNSRKRRYCSSLVKGVSYNKRSRKWAKYEYVNGKKKHLGYFMTEAQAIVQQYPIDEKDFA